MSWQMHSGKALLATGVTTGITADAVLGYWLKAPTGADTRISMIDGTYNMRALNTGSGEQQFWYGGNVPLGWTTGHGAWGNDVWTLQVHQYVDAVPAVRSYTGTTASSDVSGDSTTTWGTSELAIGRDFEGTYAASDYLIAHPFLAKRALTSGEIASLVSGANPVAVLGADCTFYLFDDYTDTYVGGYNMTQVGSGSAITWVSGDNPSVDAPPAGGGGITLAHVERGRVLARGLNRGLAP